MATVSEVVLKYAAKGAKQAQRADEKVRRGIEQTQKTAQKSAGRINRWMQANRSAIKAIAGATLAFLGALIAASPLARGELGLLRSSFGVLADTILAPLLPAITTLSLFLLDVASAIQGLPKPLQLFVSAMAVAVPLIFGLAVAFFVLSGAMAAAGITLGAIAVPLLLIVGIAAAVIGAIILLKTAWDNNWGGIQEKTEAVVGAILGAVQGVIDWFNSTFGPFLSTLRGIWEGFLNRTEGKWSKAWDSIVGTVQAVVDFIMKKVIQPFIDLFTAIWNVWGDAIVKTVQLAWNVVGTIIQNAVDFVLTTVEVALDLLAGDWKAAWNTITGFVDRAIGRIKELVKPFVDTIKAWLEPILDLIKNTVDAAKGAADVVGGAVGGAVGAIPGLQHGGIVTEPTLAMIGEAGPEAVVPLNQGGGGGPVVAGGDTVTVVVESGAVQVQGSIRDEADVDRLVSEVAERLGGRLGRRGSGV